ncbi:hypothetical protein JKF63_03819 [Porcisia hertigi]|uniref:Uncharacterized protein n=1 Tax=Porcisia hertigi TaxID=2761500 RepID=A0A836L7E1_9TRYP|nr:hypothetical protein JKF63_03819 [Porcisia hertigi]
MRTREGADEQPISRVLSRSLRSIRYGNSLPSQSEREPVGAQEIGDIANTMESLEQITTNAEAPLKESIDDQVSRIIIHEDRPIENLPLMAAPELKLLGRCVSLCLKTPANGAEEDANYYYTGLVAMVTESAVTLAHVNRYTRADFKTYKSREHRLTKGKQSFVDLPGSCNEAHNPSQVPAQQALPPRRLRTEQRPTKRGEVDAAEDAGIDDIPDPAMPFEIEVAGSLAPASPLRIVAELGAGAPQNENQEKRASEVHELGKEEEVRNAGVPNRGRRCRLLTHCTESVGPIPYVTFLRKNIRDVEFGRDPRSDFYSLFQDPSKRIVDMQYLRMFVRRYLVHTSEGNNPRQVPLYAFLSVRCAWPNVDRELVNGMVPEELRTLLKADRAIAKENKRKRVLRMQREQNVLNYRAPAGIFSRTGILYFTHIPQNLFLTATLTLLFTLGFALYLCITLGRTLESLVRSFVSQFLQHLLISVVFWTLGGVANILYGISMHLPLRENMWRFVVIVCGVVSSLACCVMCIIVFLTKMSNFAIYTHMVRAPASQLCAFYDIHQCSGFTVGCSYSASSYDPNLCDSCPGTSNLPTGCYMAIWNRLQLIGMPLLVLVIFVMISVLYALFLLAKLVLLAKALTGRFL